MPGSSSSFDSTRRRMAGGAKTLCIAQLHLIVKMHISDRFANEADEKSSDDRQACRWFMLLHCVTNAPLLQRLALQGIRL